MADINFNKASSAYQNSNSLQSFGQSSGQAVSGSQKSNAIEEISGVNSSDKIGFKPSFEELLGASLDKARDAGYKGEAISAQSVAGKAEYHELITAVNNSDLTLRTVVAVRDRIINAYQDILKMPI